MSLKVICPGCRQADRVEKVSTIYMLGIGLARGTNGSASPERPITDPTLLAMPAPQFRLLGKRLAPPSSGKPAVIKPIHPDMVVLTFSVVAPIFLYGIYTTQPGALLPVALIVAALYGAYFWKRKTVIASFDRQVQTRQADEDKIKRGIARWMKLYYCSRDDGVFEKGEHELFPADQIAGCLFRE